MENRPTKGLHYYDLQRHWTRKIVPHLDNPRLNKILVWDFHKYTFGTWAKTFKPGDLPEQFEDNDGRWNNNWRCAHRGPTPRFWRYVSHGACHWIVNFTLRLAMLTVLERPWRILASPGHSTVWDGASTLFDFNCNALGIPPDECFEVANRTELPPGRERRLTFAEHFLTDCCREGSPRYQEQFRSQEALDSFARRLYVVFRRLYPAADINECRALEITPDVIGTWSAMADDEDHPIWRHCPPLWAKIVDAVKGYRISRERIERARSEDW
jgi:hypothetical protein